MFQKSRLLTIGEQVQGLYYLPVKVENQALVIKGQKRKAKESLETQKLAKTI